MEEREPHIENIEDLFRQALVYKQRGDVYNAVKLSKKTIKIAPDWSAPFSLLGLIYKARHEWHPSLYYSQKAIENNPFDESAWQNLGIAATALQKWHIARNAWNHLGFEFPEKNKAIKMNLGLVPVRINPQSNPEIVWAYRIDPARALIESVPQPSSDRRFRDLILIDAMPSGNHIQNGQRVPVYDELQLLKRSRKWTFVALIKTDNPADLLTLDRLCVKSKMGFDNWSKATRMSFADSSDSPNEYYDSSLFGNLEREAYLVAISAEREKEVREILDAWKVVTLKNYSGLRCILKW